LKKSDAIILISSVILFGLIVWLTYNIFSPITFLFISAILFSLVYFSRVLTLRNSLSDNTENKRKIKIKATALSVVLLLLLFVISIKALQDYILPQEDVPYFNNTDYHVIRNNGVAFKDHLVLYSEEGDKENGLHASERGTLILRANKQKVQLEYDGFYKPVFGVASYDDKRVTYLINSQFNEPIKPGFEIITGSSKLTFTKIIPKEPDDHGLIYKYDIEFVFSSHDTYVIPESKNYTTDVIFLKDIVLRRGSEIKDILLKDTTALNIQRTGPLLRWLSMFRSTQILVSSSANQQEQTLNFFASADFFVSGVAVKLNGKVLTPQFKNETSFDIKDHFYVGLGSQRDSLNLLLATDNPLLQYQPYTHVLNFANLDYHRLKELSDAVNKSGNEEIRLIKNTYHGLEESTLREGLLFHEDFKANDYTALNNVFIKFTNESPGAELSKTIWANDRELIEDSFTNDFVLKSKNERVAWIYSIRDLSDNRYSFNHLKVYLAIILFFILVLVIFAPSKSMLPIEPPIWMILYVLMVFRMLLLWRVATFPPIDNISKYEFNTLQEFDLKIFGYIPFSVVLFITSIIVIFITRKLPNSSLRITSRSNTNFELYLHLCVLFGAALLSFIPVDIIKRLAYIVLPICSYFYFLHKNILLQKSYNYLRILKSNAGKYWITQFYVYWVETPVFFIALSTFFYFAIFDSGFAVMFLVFLIIKSILLNFSRATIEVRGFTDLFKVPQNFRIYAIISFLIFLGLVSVKSLPHLIIENKQVILCFILTIIIYGVYTLISNKYLKKSLAAVFFFILVLTAVTATWNQIDRRIENKIRNVKYRATMIFEPLNNILLEQEFRSGKERKIIETAQSQWYIHSYLRDVPFLVDRINFQSHFNTGIDYTTQTRDVVLPRYVISEFGSLNMLLLLILITIPLVYYFLAFRILNKEKLDADSVLGATALVLLFAIALIVWMSSTNRFVFFGQDFPFLSLTSRVSVLLPLLIAVIVLTRTPVLRKDNHFSPRLDILRWTLFFLFMGLFITIAGKSRELTERNFKPDLSAIEARFNGTLNELFIETQNLNKSKVADIKGSKLELYSQLSKWIGELSRNKTFIKLKRDSLSRYEVSILKSIEEIPARGFDIRSPLHIINKGNVYHFKFNPYFQFELPAHDNKLIWKGDVFEQKYAGRPVYLTNSIGMVIVPSSFLEKGKESFALIDMVGQKVDVQLYKLKSRKIDNYRSSDFVQKITNDDLVLYREDSDSTYKMWNLEQNRRKYFAYNVRVNGKQRLIYPLGKDFFWAREWSMASKHNFEKLGAGKLNSSSQINLDYDLTQKVSQYLRDLMNSTATNKKTNSRSLQIGVVAADGDGRIRLMVDDAMLRQAVDPNDERSISELMKEEYFFWDNERARIQWANTNLIHMKMGPGSSIKPLVLASVTSQKKLEWEDLRYIPTSNLIENPGNPNQFIVTKYAGKDLPIGIGRWVEEKFSNTSTNLRQYLARSNNLYHSLIVFFGSYKKVDFPNGSFKDQIKMVKSSKDFPIFQIGNNLNYTLPDSAFWPKSDNISKNHFGNELSMLSKGFANIFELRTYSSSSSGLLNEKRNFSKMDDGIMNKQIWAFPESSYFDQKEREANFAMAIQNTTLGGGIFRITPLHMLEMYGKLFNYDTKFRLYIDSSTGKRSEWANVDNTWGSDFKNVFLKEQLFQGMREVVDNGGTGSYLAQLRTAYPGYSIYAKTGTIGNSKGDNSKRLVVVISKDQGNGITVQKKVLIYFTIQDAYIEDKTFDNKTWFQPHMVNILSEIMNSESFTQYLGQQ
jgi:hypothetical protein